MKKVGCEEHRVDYVPGDSNTYLFGGNSNWRGPVWLCGDITEAEFVGWNLTIWCHVPLTQKQNELVFSKLRIQLGKWYHVKSQIPGSILQKTNFLESICKLVYVLLECLFLYVLFECFTTT